MTGSSASTSEHVYRGWKIRITDTAVDTKSSPRVEVWKMPMSPLLQRRRSGLTQKWFDRGRRRHRLVKKIP